MSKKGKIPNNKNEKIKINILGLLIFEFLNPTINGIKITVLLLLFLLIKSALNQT